MKVKYNVHNRYTWEYSDKVESDLAWFLESHLTGGIESKIEKLLGLAKILTLDHLSRHPEDIEKVAEVLNVDGRNFEIYESND
jgi:hypothetical protein